ncbi:helix-turn-helix domain-containing protein [Candidatus Ruminimicrobium bovinum]|uniref:helix-turn-helix domain-containing protein n=1 Tax=Candidatus Ruminimicrobium bovinum TaxID=3242779 RepID=UPI0039B9A387
MNIKKQLIKSYQEKFNNLKKVRIEKPLQGWIKTIRELLGMTSVQFSKKLKISQPRLAVIEKNEKNLKLSTMKKIADELNCDFVYALVPRENVNDIIYNRAKQKALNIVTKVNNNMSLENQLSDNKEILEDTIEYLLSKKAAKIWDED